MLDVSDEVRAEIGAEEADRLAAGVGAPGSYDCTSCRAPGNPSQERTSAVLFVGGETAVIAFAHASCIPSQVVTVPEDKLRSAVASITDDAPDDAQPATTPAVDAAASTAANTAANTMANTATGVTAPTGPATGVPAPTTASPSATPAAAPSPASSAPSAPTGTVPRPPTAPAADNAPESRQAVLGITCGQLALSGELHAALAVEPTSAIARPDSPGTEDEFLALLAEQGFAPVRELARPPAPLQGWSVLLAMGQLHAILQPGSENGRPVAWWRAHQPVAMPEAWRATATRNRAVLVYAAPAGAIGQQPREDLLREALERAAAQGVLAAATMRITGT